MNTERSPHFIPAPHKHSIGVRSSSPIHLIVRSSTNRLHRHAPRHPSSDSLPCPDISRKKKSTIQFTCESEGFRFHLYDAYTGEEVLIANYLVDNDRFLFFRMHLSCNDSSLKYASTVEEGVKLLQEVLV